MIVIPTSPAEAQNVLAELRAQHARVTLLVVMAGGAGQELAEQADIRADGQPFRQVAWASNAAVLANAPGYADVRAKVAAGAVVCALTLDGNVAATLSANDPLDLLALEKAFLSAGAG